MKIYIRKLLDNPNDFSIKDFDDALEIILSGEATDAQIGGFLALLARVPLSIDMVAECARFLLSRCLKPTLENAESHIIADIVGTGGDGFDTFNASTTAAIVVAGCECGIMVAKHGNRSSSSCCGSADLLEAAGCGISTTVSIDGRSGFCFLFAPMYHPSMKQLGVIRKQLGIPTLFNLMGPLINPLRPNVMIVGVARRHDGPIMAHVLSQLGTKKILVVHGAEGLDEISPAGPTFTWTVEGGELIEKTISPADFGFDPVTIESVKGGGPSHNAEVLLKLLNNQLVPNDPMLTFVLMNAAALLFTAGICANYKEGVSMARDSVQSGRALKAFLSYKSVVKQ